MRKKLSLASGLLAALVSGGLWVSPQNSGAAAGFSYPSKVKEWTVMVYMNGKSDLEENDFENINNMETAGSSKEVNVVAEYARTRGQKNDFTGDGDWTGSRRYYIQKDIDSKKINSPVLAQFARPDMGDWRHLAAFIRWAKTNFPARRYMLVLRHHGGGWIDPRPSPKAMSYDDEMGTFIATVDMGKIFQEAGPVDIYLNDVCLMQSLETLYEVRDGAKYVIGSEDLSYGYYYYKLIKGLTDRPALSTEEAVSMTINTYGEAHTGHVYAGAIMEYQASAVKTAASGDFYRLLSAWAAAARQSGDRKALIAARDVVKRFSQPAYADLKNFLDIYIARADIALPGAARPLNAARALKEQFENRMLFKNMRIGRGFDPAGGLSVYIPSKDSPMSLWLVQYKKLGVSSVPAWTDFLSWLGELK